MKKIVIINGSFRKESFNLQLANEIKSIIGSRAQISILKYDDLPFMNEDIEFPAPESVARVRNEILQADGIWIISPEYNYQIPGTLKNLLDWLSRPLIPRNRNTSVVYGKFVTLSSAAGKSKGIGVRTALNNLLTVMSMQVIDETGTGILLDAEAFNTGNLILNDDARQKLKKQADLFINSI